MQNTIDTSTPEAQSAAAEEYVCPTCANEGDCPDCGTVEPIPGCPQCGKNHPLSTCPDICRMNVLGTRWTICGADSDGPCMCDVVVFTEPKPYPPIHCPVCGGARLFLADDWACSCAHATPIEPPPPDDYAPLGACAVCSADAWLTTAIGLLCPEHELLDPADSRCANCGNEHAVQDCPEVKAALMAPSCPSCGDPSGYSVIDTETDTDLDFHPTKEGAEKAATEKKRMHGEWSRYIVRPSLCAACRESGENLEAIAGDIGGTVAYVNGKLTIVEV